MFDQTSKIKLRLPEDRDSFAESLKESFSGYLFDFVNYADMFKISGNKVQHTFYYNPREISRLDSKINTWVEKVIGLCAICLFLFMIEPYTGLNFSVQLIGAFVIIAVCFWIYYKYNYKFDKHLYEEHRKVLEFLKKYEID